MPTSYLLAAAGFVALIVLHELGHFLAAKAVGMRVERFFLFFPPKLVGVKRGETEYGIGAIPLGGFVKITGMNPEEELPPDVAARGYYRQPVWKRIVVIAAGPVMNLVIAFLILFALGFGAERPTELEVAGIVTDSPAESALEEGDVVRSVDGVAGSGLSLDDRAARFAELTDSHACRGEPEDGCRARTPVELVVVRDGERVPLELRPYYDAEAEQNRIGFLFREGGEGEPLDLSAPQAAERSLDFMWFVTSETVSTIAQLFDPEKREEISGVVGGYETTRQAIELDTRTALTIIAVISLSLAVINLFPFLPLDGGHIFWSVVEKVRGRPVPFSVMERSGVIGFILVLVLFTIGLTNDIGRLSGEGFDLR